MSNNGKSKHGFWLTPEAKEKVEKFYRIDNCKSNGWNCQRRRVTSMRNFFWTDSTIFAIHPF